MIRATGTSRRIKRQTPMAASQHPRSTKNKLGGSSGMLRQTKPARGHKSASLSRPNHRKMTARDSRNKVQPAESIQVVERMVVNLNKQRPYWRTQAKLLWATLPIRELCLAVDPQAVIHGCDDVGRTDRILGRVAS